MENIKDEVRKFMKERDWLNQPRLADFERRHLGS